MGIFDFVTGGSKELAIARPDEAKALWVFKHPDKTIPNKAQLTVDTDEVALFFKDGKYVGQFNAGRHSLETENIPWLNILIDKFTDGNVFVAEVYFVNTREHPSLKFGTSVGDVLDPQTQMRARLTVHGDFSAKVFDPTKFITGLVGQRQASNDDFVDWFKSQVQKTIKDHIAELIVKQEWPLLKVTSGAFTEEIEVETVKLVRKHVEPYGVEIMRFGDFTIGMDEKDKEKLDAMVQRQAMLKLGGGIEGYKELAQAEMMMGASEGMKQGGEGGGGALAGAGMGMGMAMANQMMAQPAQSANAAPSSDAIMKTLKELAQLRDAGVVSEEEFAQKKKELLAKL